MRRRLPHPPSFPIPARVAGGLAVLAVVVVLGGWGCGGTPVEAGVDPGPGPEPVELVVERGHLVLETLLSGEIAARDAEPLLVPNVNVWPAQILWLMEDGSSVAEGDRVVAFDTTQLSDDLERLERAVEDAESELLVRRTRVESDLQSAAFDVLQAEADLEKARLDADLPEGLLAPQELDDRRLEVRRRELGVDKARQKLASLEVTSEADLEILELALERARTAERVARRRIALLTIHAPRDGLFLTGYNRREGRPWKSGDSIAPGTVVASLPDLTSLYVEAELTDVDDGAVTQGLELTATLDALAGETWSGRVTSVDTVAREPNLRSSRRVFTVTLDLDGLDPARVRPGMSVKAVVRHTVDGVLLVPRIALDWSAGSPRVHLAGGDRREVELGRCDAWRCEVLAGVDDGDRLRTPEEAS